jgi:hypothetical protein
MKVAMQTTRRWIVALVIVTLMAAMAAYGPVALNMAGVEAGTPLYACSHTGGGC